jgi:hypothetical protein
MWVFLVVWMPVYQMAGYPYAIIPAIMHFQPFLLSDAWIGKLQIGDTMILFAWVGGRLLSESVIE